MNSVAGKVLNEMVLDIQAMRGGNLKSLGRFWNRICFERGWTKDCETDEKAMFAFFAALDLDSMVAVVGEKIVGARWLSFPKGERQRRRYWTTNLWILLLWAIEAGCINSLWDVIRDVPMRKFLPSDKDKPIADAAGGLAAALVHESTASCAMERSAELTSEQYKRCKNQIHVCLETAADIDIRDSCTMIGICSNVWTLSHARALKLARTRDGCIQYFAELADWHWLETDIWPIFDICFDADLLEQMGVSTKPPAKFTGKAFSADEVAAQDAICALIWDLQFAMIQNRCRSMVPYSQVYPLACAKTLRKSRPDAQKEYFQDFAIDVQVFHEAKKRKETIVQDWVRKSPLNEPVMKVTELVVNTKCVAMHRLICEYYEGIFCAIASAKMCEDTNKEAVGVESRAQMSRVVQQIRRSYVPIDKQIVTQWGRPNLARSTSLNPPQPLEEMFKTTEPQKQSEVLDFDRILRKPFDWTTMVPEEMHTVASERSAIRHIAGTKSWDLVGELWQSQLIPASQIIVAPDGSHHLGFSIVIPAC